jgi:hypothetical protein
LIFPSVCFSQAALDTGKKQNADWFGSSSRGAKNENEN